ncbi:Hypothetical_protein [Hexamita inflata]|uniref:Hypothetical_protein n=1 Tax=Hexamita inflata TaxID=28002 RepID=A0AA86NCD7_9EUKA|nr:Hypothetical protein HINF_LOCUS4764 [Hexamita inflata]
MFVCSKTLRVFNLASLELSGHFWEQFNIKTCLLSYLSVQGVNYNSFGIVEYQYDNSINAEMLNLRTSVCISFNNGNYVGSIFGIENAKNCSVQNASVVGENITGLGAVGGLIGDQWYDYNNLTIMNSLIYQTNITASNEVVYTVNYIQQIQRFNQCVFQVVLSDLSLFLVLFIQQFFFRLNLCKQYFKK